MANRLRPFLSFATFFLPVVCSPPPLQFVPDSFVQTPSLSFIFTSLLIPVSSCMTGTEIMPALLKTALAALVQGPDGCRHAMLQVLRGSERAKCAVDPFVSLNLTTPWTPSPCGTCPGAAATCPSTPNCNQAVPRAAGCDCKAGSDCTTGVCSSATAKCSAGLMPSSPPPLQLPSKVFSSESSFICSGGPGPNQAHCFAFRKADQTGASGYTCTRTAETSESVSINCTVSQPCAGEHYADKDGRVLILSTVGRSPRDLATVQGAVLPGANTAMDSLCWSCYLQLALASNLDYRLAVSTPGSSSAVIKATSNNLLKMLRGNRLPIQGNLTDWKPYLYGFRLAWDENSGDEGTGGDYSGLMWSERYTPVHILTVPRALIATVFPAM